MFTPVWLMIFNFQRGWFNHQRVTVMGRLTSLPFLCREPGAGPPALAEYLGMNVRQGLFIDIFGAFITVMCKYFYYIDSYFFTLFLQPLFYFVTIFNIGISQQKSVPHSHSPFLMAPADYVTSRNYVIRCWFIVGSWAILSKRRFSNVFSPFFHPKQKHPFHFVSHTINAWYSYT